MGQERLKAIGEEAFEAIFLDLKLGSEDGLEVMGRLLKADPSLVIVMFTAYANIATAVEAMRIGAYDFIPKPFTPDQIRGVLAKISKTKALEHRVYALKRTQIRVAANRSRIARSLAMQRSLEIAFKAADTPASVLILGPSGTGKSVSVRRASQKKRSEGRSD